MSSSPLLQSQHWAYSVGEAARVLLQGGSRSPRSRRPTWHAQNMSGTGTASCSCEWRKRYRASGTRPMRLQRSARASIVGLVTPTCREDHAAHHGDEPADLAQVGHRAPQRPQVAPDGTPCSRARRPCSWSSTLRSSAKPRLSTAWSIASRSRRNRVMGLPERSTGTLGLAAAGRPLSGRSERPPPAQKEPLRLQAVASSKVWSHLFGLIS